MINFAVTIIALLLACSSLAKLFWSLYNRQEPLDLTEFGKCVVLVIVTIGLLAMGFVVVLTRPY